MRLKLVCGTQPNAKNKMQVSGSLTGPVLRYSCGVINLHQETLTKLHREKREQLAIHGNYHNKADVERWYVPRRQGRRGLIQLEEAYIAAVNETDGISAKQGRSIDTNCQNAPMQHDLNNVTNS